jgi:hypothetical protein
MAINTALCNSFKSELLHGIHDLSSDTIKLALIKANPAGTYGVATTNYSNVTDNSDEAQGSNYQTGGQALDSVTITQSGSTSYVDIADETFPSVTLSSDGCILYNASKGNRAICVLSFDTTVSISGDFIVTFPAADINNAIIRIS